MTSPRPHRMSPGAHSRRPIDARTDLATAEGAFLGMMRAAARFHSPEGLNGRACGLCAETGSLCWRGEQVAANLAALEREMGLAS